MKGFLILLVLLVSTTIYCQYSKIDTVIWKHNAGYRSELFHFDSVYVKGLVEQSETNGCNVIIDFLQQVEGELGKYEGFSNGFSDEIRTYAFKLSVTKGICVTEVLDHYAQTAKFINGGSSYPTLYSNYPFLKEIQENIEDYLPYLNQVIIETDYEFQFRNSPDIILRKSIALLLNQIASSVTEEQFNSLTEERQEYVKSILLEKGEAERIKDPSSKFPIKL